MLDYRLSVETGKDRPQRLLIDLQPGIVSEARAEIAAIVTVRRQRRSVSTHCVTYLRPVQAQHRFAPNAWSQFLALSRTPSRRRSAISKRSCRATWTSRYRSIRTTNSHVIPQPDRFWGVGD